MISQAMHGQARAFHPLFAVGAIVKQGKETTTRARLQNLLVPVDFSTAALGAVRYAAALAARHRSNIVLLHVATAAEPHNAVEKAKAKLSRLRREEGITTDRCRLLVRVGVPFFEITQTADGTDVDLIILGRCCRTPNADAQDGHTLDRVVRYAHCPVLLVREEDGGRGSKRPIE